MTGSLRFPVQLRILDGKTVAMKIVLSGKRLPEDALAHTFIADDNADYTVEWGQCENERAPSPVAEGHGKLHAPRPQREGESTYECGEAQVYKTDKLVTKKGDPTSHALTFIAPPKPECWVGDAPAPANAASDAGAPEAGAGTAGGALDGGADASALAVDSGAAADSGAPPTDGGRGAVDGRATAADGGRGAVDGRVTAADGGRGTVDGRATAADAGSGPGADAGAVKDDKSKNATGDKDKEPKK
jgi:hypothetical protein